MGLLNALVAHGYRLYYSTKLPASISADAIKALAAELVKSNTFLSFIYCALFFFGREVNWVLLPLGVTAAYQSLIFLSKHAATHELWRRFGERAHAYAMANMEKALVLTAITEVRACGGRLGEGPRRAARGRGRRSVAAAGGLLWRAPGGPGPRCAGWGGLHAAAAAALAAPAGGPRLRVLEPGACAWAPPR